MTDHNPTPAIPDDVPTSVVYDMLADTATNLSARYVKLSENATTEDERRRWWNKVIELRDARLAVGAHDRDAMITNIAVWTAEIRLLKERRG
ncbi:hypothetical protein ACIRYZ_36615 [Kitasatospora sp. NPDC101155]|uniref:hypothetical protein n=1 Tax=Kitasatospora sp. NPDC101155 TaxID=3364097 RepID=UPI0037F6E8BF